eukprot:262991-Heterocapsa_arctica.AAC.1
MVAHQRSRVELPQQLPRLQRRIPRLPVPMRRGCYLGRLQTREGEGTSPQAMHGHPGRTPLRSQFPALGMAHAVR